MLILFFKVKNYVERKLIPSIGDISPILGTLLLFMMHWLCGIDVISSEAKSEI